MADDLDREPLRQGSRTVERSHVVVGVDGSPASERALDYAFGLASRLAARVLVVHVRRTRIVTTTLGAEALLNAPGLDPELRGDIDALASRCGVDVTYLDLSSVGHAAPVLAQVAEAHHADVVVVGTSHKLLHRVTGSTGAHLVKHCHCPVTVVP
jgi:nucleotide-binding universal stress UspA family protein